MSFLKSYAVMLKQGFTTPQFYVRTLFSPTPIVLFYCLFSLSILGLAHSLYLFSVQVPLFQHDSKLIAQAVKSKLSNENEFIWDGKKIQSPLLQDQSESENPQTVAIATPPEIRLPYLQKFTYVLIWTESTDLPILSHSLNENSWLVINPQTFYFRDSTGNWQSIALTVLLGESPLQWNREQIDSQLNQVIQGGVVIGYPLLIFGFITTIVWRIFSYLFIALFESLVLYLFSRINRFMLTYNQLFKSCLALMVVVGFIKELSSLLYPASSGLVQSSVLFWILLFYIIFNQRKVLELVLRPHELS